MKVKNSAKQGVVYSTLDTYLQTKYWHALHETYFWFLRFRKLTCSVDQGQATGMDGTLRL